MLRTNTLLHCTLIFIDYRSISISQNNIFSKILYTIKWWRCGPIFGIFRDLLLTATTQPLGTQNVWHRALTLLMKKHLIFDHSCFSLFTQKTWGFISEIGQLGPILDLKPISLFSFFTAVEIVHVTIGNPGFCLVLYLTDVTFRGELQHVGHVGGQKIKCRPIKTR